MKEQLSFKSDFLNEKVLNKPLATHIEGIDRVRTAYVMYEDTPIATLTEEYSSLSGESSWVLKPFYDVLDAYRGKRYCAVS